ncbi:MAG: electron transport complex subunit RsxA [Candidatus Cloacimonetes bacterium]|nr:electron transport complex subunit RsxA [Candidatus Cloacimonadota bacterium]
MELVGRIFALAVAAIFVQNFVLSRFLGLCPYIGVSKKLDSAIGMGMAVVFVMTMASTITWMIQYFLLKPLHIEFLQTIAFILTIASLVQLVEMVIQKTAPALYKSLGVFLPLITTNCAVLGVSILNINEQLTFFGAILNGLFGGLGFTLVLILMAGIRERLEKADIPQAMRGMPIAMIVAGSMAMAFLGFSGMSL